MVNPGQQGELVKRFVAPSMRRALQMVSEELGPEAVILSSQKTPRGVEIVVSLEPDFRTRGIDVRREFGQNFDADLDSPMNSDSAWRVQAGMEKAAEKYGAYTHQDNKRSSEDLAREIEQAREKMMAAKRAVKNSEEPIGYRRVEDQKIPQAEIAGGKTDMAYSNDERQLQELQTEIADMRLLLEQQLWRMSESTPQQINFPKQVQLNPNDSTLNSHLERLGLHSKLIDELKDAVANETRPSLAWRNAMAVLSRRLPTFEQELISRGGVFAFVGPTGVGKTTTIAKLAAKFVLQHGPGKVAIVTTDTYRVGAHDQLRSLGRILGVPVRVVDKENNIARVVASLKKFPLVLVDTAGYRHGDRMLKQQLKQLDTCPFMKRILVLACNSQYQNLKASVHAYSSERKVDACVLSKLDETTSLGEAISVVTQESLRVAYVTDGQEIPADIQMASGHNLIAKAVSLLKQSTSNQNAVG